MPILFSCPKCQSKLTATDDKAGVKFPCPQCGQRLQVPAPPPLPTSQTMIGDLDLGAMKAMRREAGPSQLLPAPISPQANLPIPQPAPMLPAVAPSLLPVKVSAGPIVPANGGATRTFLAHWQRLRRRRVIAVVGAVGMLVSVIAASTSYWWFSVPRESREGQKWSNRELVEYLKVQGVRFKAQGSGESVMVLVKEQTAEQFLQAVQKNYIDVIESLSGKF